MNEKTDYGMAAGRMDSNHCIPLLLSHMPPRGVLTLLSRFKPQQTVQPSWLGWQHPTGVIVLLLLP